MKNTQSAATSAETALRPVSCRKTATGVTDTLSEANLWQTQMFTTELRWGVPYSQSDPLGEIPELGTSANSIHLFGYAHQNPIRFSDHVGLSPCDHIPAPAEGLCAAGCIYEMRRKVCLAEKTERAGAFLDGFMLGGSVGIFCSVKLTPVGGVVCAAVGGVAGYFGGLGIRLAAAGEGIESSTNKCLNDCKQTCPSPNPRYEFDIDAWEH